MGYTVGKLTDAEKRWADAATEVLMQENRLTIHGAAVDPESYVALAMFAHLLKQEYVDEYMQAMLTAHDLLLTIRPYLAAPTVESIKTGSKGRYDFH